MLRGMGNQASRGKRRAVGTPSLPLPRHPPGSHRQRFVYDRQLKLTPRGACLAAGPIAFDGPIGV